MHVDEVEGILALFLICLRQIATSKKLLNRLSGFLDNIHDVLLFTMHKSCARIVCPGRPKCLAQFSLEYMATRLSGYAKTPAAHMTAPDQCCSNVRKFLRG